jgi:hypothetical protein
MAIKDADFLAANPDITRSKDMKGLREYVVGSSPSNNASMDVAQRYYQYLASKDAGTGEEAGNGTRWEQVREFPYNYGGGQYTGEPDEIDWSEYEEEDEE